MDINTIKTHLYNDSVQQSISYVSKITDEDSLFTYAFNYNWDNGFEIPQNILSNPNCTLSIALLLFHMGDGLTYVCERNTSDSLPNWNTFITTLYDRILSNSFPPGKTMFNPSLSKTQVYKIKKILSDDELILITPIEGTDCYINL